MGEGHGLRENLAFTERAISHVQPLSIKEHPLAISITDYLIRMGRMLYDCKRDLFWVIPPSGKMQVAAWMMPLLTSASSPDSSEGE